MKQVRSAMTASLISAAILLVVIAGCSMQPSEQHKPRTTLFIGVDASGSFKNSGYYDNALTFLAHYIYGHLNELGGLEKPKMLFVASVGGKSRSEHAHASGARYRSEPLGEARQAAEGPSRVIGNAPSRRIFGIGILPRTP